MKNKKLIIFLFIGIIVGFFFSRVLEVRVKVPMPAKKIVSKIKSVFKLGRSGSSGGSAVLSFEKDDILRRIEKSKVTVERSQDQVKEGKYSLKVTFPDGGGAIGFYDVLPHDWQKYSSLSFDVYSQDAGVPLSLFIADTNNKAYYDRFNMENIRLNSGWNHIKIPISEIDKKLILDRVNNLRIFLWNTKGIHILFFGTIRLISKDDKENILSDKPIKIFINPSVEKGAISRLIYGTNLSAKMESDRKIWDFVKDAGITCFRFPGGGSPGWHWNTGVGDFKNKMVGMPLSNIDYLIKFCKKTNTQLIMQVNIESGTPEEAAGLVHYMNNVANFRVEYWELGNEVYGDWDKAYTTPQKYAEIIKQYSLAMKAKDPTIKIGADWGEKYYDRVSWDRTIMKQAGDYIDFVSIHWYPNHTSKRHPRNGSIHPTPEDVMGNSEGIPYMVKRVHEIIQEEAPQRKGKIEVTFLEWDGSWDAPSNDPKPYTKDAAMWSLANAIFYADCLGKFAENGVTVSAHYTLQECMFGLIRGWDPAEGWGGQAWDEITIRPKAFAIKLFSRYFGDTLVHTKLENVPSYDKSNDWWPGTYAGKVPYISCYAGKFANSGKLTVILINKHPERDFNAAISIADSFMVNNKAAVYILKRPSATSQNDGQPGTVRIRESKLDSIKNNFNCVIPAHSVALIEMEKQQ